MSTYEKLKKTLCKAVFCGVIAVAFVIAATPASAAVDSAGGPMPYARLAALWWQWVLEVPTSTNPLIDPTGANCGVNQKGDIWFLAGTTSGNAIRTCTIPAGKTIFFPVVNYAYFAFLTDPPGTKSIGYEREQVSCVVGSTFWATLDGVLLSPVHEKSIPFVVHLPEDNIFGAGPDVIKNLMLAPSVDEGDYVLLQPISPGSHTIVFVNAVGNTNSCSSDLNVTYNIIVE